MMEADEIDEAMIRSAVPPPARAGWRALRELDATFGGILRNTREPMVGQMRLTWWHEALTALDVAPPPAQPVLQGLAGYVLPRGVRGDALADMIDGWELLLDGPALEDATLSRFATIRGGGLFRALAGVLVDGRPDDVVASILSAAGECWALDDLGTRLSDATAARRAARLADERYEAAFDVRWPRALRPLGVLTIVGRARRTGNPAPGGPALALRLIRFRITGK